jgi:hypothetical protein
MIWIKSFGMGLLAALITVPMIFVCLGLILKAKSGLPSIGIDVVAYSRELWVRLIILLAFLIGASGSIAGSVTSDGTSTFASSRDRNEIFYAALLISPIAITASSNRSLAPVLSKMLCR